MPKEYEELREEALYNLRSYMDSLDPKKGRILAYWIKDYTRFLKKEATFDPKKLIRYKRGSIVKAHLGYRIGSEEGGLHYAVVIDVHNALSSKTLTVIPLTSLKPTSKIYTSQVLLGDEIYNRLESKIIHTIEEAEVLERDITQRLAELENMPPDADGAKPTITAFERRLLSGGIDTIKQKISLAKKMSSEIHKMKTVSIALVNQITTISKIRIYDPMYPLDTLSGIRLSDESLDKLDTQIRALYTKTDK